VVLQSVEYAGKHYEAKIKEVQEFLVTKKAQAIIFTMLDEIAWLFNIRGSDVTCNPVVISYAVVTAEKAHFFVNKSKLSAVPESYFDPAIVDIREYSETESFLNELRDSSQVVLVDSNQLNWRLYLALGTSVSETISPITLSKSLKNDAEIAGIRNAHIKDGAALTAFLHWLEVNVRANPNTISECDAVDKADEFRRKMPHHVGPSFETISGYGPNGAIIHYKPNRDTCARLGTDSLFLLDSGAQYHDGTTDVTRTLHFGEPTQRMKDCFTLVLKGHINLARVIFPEGTTGHRLDSLARLPLWSFGLDYNHGTGHGVRNE
jgi:Xaa-Pro aminopeptidase